MPEKPTHEVAKRTERELPKETIIISPKGAWKGTFKDIRLFWDITPKKAKHQLKWVPKTNQIDVLVIPKPNSEGTEYELTAQLKFDFTVVPQMPLTSPQYQHFASTVEMKYFCSTDPDGLRGSLKLSPLKESSFSANGKVIFSWSVPMGRPSSGQLHLNAQLMGTISHHGERLTNKLTGTLKLEFPQAKFGFISRSLGTFTERLAFTVYKEEPLEEEEKEKVKKELPSAKGEEVKTEAELTVPTQAVSSESAVNGKTAVTPTPAPKVEPTPAPELTVPSHKDVYKSYLGKTFTIKTGHRLGVKCKREISDTDYVKYTVKELESGAAAAYAKNAWEKKKIQYFKRIPNGTKVTIVAYKDGWAKVDNYGWVHRSKILGGIINETFGLSKATYDSMDPFHKTIGDPKAIIREYKGSGVYKGKKVDDKYLTIAPGEYIIVKEKSSDTDPPGLYVKVAFVKEVGGKMVEDTSKGQVWTHRNNLAEGWADFKGPHAAWERGKYTGQVDLVNIVNHRGQIRQVTAETITHFNALQTAAANAEPPIKLRLISGFRDYLNQKELREGWESGKLPYKAARPGFSRHQNGLAIDLNAWDENSPEYQWLIANAPKYGFIRTESTENHHWVYMPHRIKKSEIIIKNNKKYTRIYYTTFSNDYIDVKQ